MNQNVLSSLKCVFDCEVLAVFIWFIYVLPENLFLESSNFRQMSILLLLPIYGMSVLWKINFFNRSLLHYQNKLWYVQCSSKTFRRKLILGQVSKRSKWKIYYYFLNLFSVKDSRLPFFIIRIFNKKSWWLQ